MRYNDFSIRTKMLLGFAVVIIFTVILSVVSYINMGDVDTKYTWTIDGTIARRADVSDILSNYLEMRRAGLTAIVYAGDADQVTAMQKELDASMAEIKQSYDVFVANLPTDIVVDDAERADEKTKIDSVYSLVVEQYYPVLEQVMDACMTGDVEAAKALLGTCAQYAAQIDTETTALRGLLVDRSASMNIANTDATNLAKLVTVALAVVIAIISIIIAMVQSGSIKKSVVKVAGAAHEISKGNLSVEVGSNDKDELGKLSNSLLEVKNVVNSLVSETKAVSSAMAEGDIKKRMELTAYSGEYRAFAETINKTFDGVVDEVLYAIEMISNFGEGNFDFTVRTFPGDKIILTNSALNVQKNLKSISGEIKNLIESASAGQLDKRIDSTKFKGDWAKITNGINSLLVAIVVPINESISTLTQLSNGNLSASVSGQYQGDFAKMKDTLNNTISMLKTYISEIGSTLGKMSEEDLTVSITREYVGDFNEIKSSINNILNTFNKLVTDINNSAAQVASGAQQISEASMNLAQGSTEQASSIEELNATVDDVAAKTSKNAASADHANNLALQTRQHAQEGNKEMKNMLDSMHQINESSNNISNIIKVIEDIAFQTNLLALNAAVEAARAGQYGKGFAVVAEEVRSLAARSQKAVKDTSELIQGSVEKVSEGSAIADKTAEALNAIVIEIDEISKIINEVAESSLQQSEAISQINVGITQIANVTQANSATSEEQASSSQELSSQATLFKAMVNQFKLRG